MLMSFPRDQADPPSMGTTKEMSQPLPQVSFGIVRTTMCSVSACLSRRTYSQTDLTEPQSKPSQSLPLFSMVTSGRGAFDEQIDQQLVSSFLLSPARSASSPAEPVGSVR